MTGLPRILLVLAAIAFALAVITSFTGPLGRIMPEGFARACNGLSLLAIAVHLIYRPGGGSTA